MANYFNINQFKAHFSAACYPGFGITQIMESVSNQWLKSDPKLGDLSLKEIQLCPQNCIEILTPETIDRLKANYPETQFRLHANVRVEDKHHVLADLSLFNRYKEYFGQLAKLSQQLNAKAYTLHAGLRKKCSKKQLLEFRLHLEDLFMVPVGIEGLYPTRDNRYWIDSWAEYEWLLTSGVPYALDLSHINILAIQSQTFEIDLVKALLSSPCCIEIHLSHNDGESDTHLSLSPQEYIWWVDFLNLANPNAVIFYEGNLRKLKQSIDLSLKIS